MDIYDAVTSNRIYHDGMAPHHAPSMMYNEAPQFFDCKLFEEFMRCLGTYPVGSVLRLDAGEVAVVTTAGPRRHLRPVALLLLVQQQKPYTRPRYLNLAVPHGGGSDSEPRLRTARFSGRSGGQSARGTRTSMTTNGARTLGATRKRSIQ